MSGMNPMWETNRKPTQAEKNRAHYAKKAAQRKLRQDLRGTPEDQRINRNIWRWVFVVMAVITGLIYILPAWVFGLCIVILIGVVAMVAIAAGTSQGRGE